MSDCGCCNDGRCGCGGCSCGGCSCDGRNYGGCSCGGCNYGGCNYGRCNYGRGKHGRDRWRRHRRRRRSSERCDEGKRRWRGQNRIAGRFEELFAVGRFVGHHSLNHFAAVPVESRESHPHAVQAFVRTRLIGCSEAHHALAAQGHPCVAEHDLKAHGAANLQRLAHRQEQASSGQIASEAGDEVVEGGIVQSTAQRGQR